MSHKCVSVMLFLSCCLPLHANNTIASSNEKEHVALRALLEKAQTALNNKDPKALRECLANEFAFTAIDQTLITTAQELQDCYDKMFNASDAPLLDMKSEPKAAVPSIFLSDNIAYCYGTSFDTYTLKDGRKNSFNARWTVTCIKENDQWKAATVHIGTNFLDNAILTSVVDSGKKMMLGTFVLGLLIGFIFAKLIRKKTN